MQKRWTNQHIDLADLTDRTVRFLEAEDFEVIEVRTATGYEIIAENSTHYEIKEGVSIIIGGNAEELSVNLELRREGRGEHLSLPVMLATMMGGGYFLLKHLKSEEAWAKFKNDFWKRMDTLIASSKHSANMP